LYLQVLIFAGDGTTRLRAFVGGSSGKHLTRLEAAARAGAVIRRFKSATRVNFLGGAGESPAHPSVKARRQPLGDVTSGLIIGLVVHSFTGRGILFILKLDFG